MLKKLTSINPAQNYQINGTLEASSREEILTAVNLANTAKLFWGAFSVSERVVYLQKVYQVLFSNVERIVDLIAKEIGTPYQECKDEVLWDFDYFKWFLDNAQTILSPKTTHEDQSSLSQIFYEPIGSAAVITPWNLPFDMFIWGVIPNLIVGNTVVYKSAEQCCLSGKLYAELLNESGLPDGVFNVIHGDGEEGQILVEADIDLIWFTGSTQVGKALYELAGKKFIRATMEMGGSNPAIIFANSDLEQAVARVVGKRFFNCGQTCDAVKRVLVEESVYQEVLSLLKKKIAERAVVPLVSKDQLEKVESQVQASVGLGAKIEVGGERPRDKQGAYYLPTLMTQITKQMSVWNEEVFGPVLPVMTFNNEEEAIVLANDSQYGLGAQIFTRDIDRAKRVASRLQAGAIDINGGNHWLPENPFGGYKNSGIGREHGEAGLLELCQLKVVSLKK
jgi:acyl-CoA reductase-like NAD-dependent aldehyde dehydrogenase